MRRWPLAWSVVYGLRAAVFGLLLGEVLVPDTSLYVDGRAWWSSPFLAAFGVLGGLTAVQLVAVGGASLVGWIVGTASRWWWGLAVFLSPPGWYLIQAGADGVGSAGAGFAARLLERRRSGLVASIAVAALHLEAGLVCACIALVGGDRRTRMAVSIAAGAGACVGQWHLQVRYFLPGLVYCAVVAR